MTQVASNAAAEPMPTSCKVLRTLPRSKRSLIFAASSSIGAIDPTSSISWNSLVHKVA
ncbi:hypothetical protein D3C87_2025270 [compost metagenome]